MQAALQLIFRPSLKCITHIEDRLARGHRPDRDEGGRVFSILDLKSTDKVLQEDGDYSKVCVRENTTRVA